MKKKKFQKKAKVPPEIESILKLLEKDFYQIVEFVKSQK